MKACSTCKKTDVEFAKNKRMPDGLQNCCKPCQHSYRKLKIRDPITCPNCQAVYYSISKRNRAGYCTKRCQEEAKYKRDKVTMRKRSLQRMYGITLEQYNMMLLQQRFKCALCESEDPGGRGRFHVDHCHDTGKVRALLCHYCNTALGSFRDDPELMEKAASYLRAHQ